MNFLKSKRSWMAAPILWFATLCTLFAVWAFSPCTEEWLATYIDNDGRSFVEVVTIGFFVLQFFCIWLIPPMEPGKRRVFWQVDFSLITWIAVCRELDWHKAWINMEKISQIPGASHGTPFKMRFLTNSANPLADRLIVLLCFVVVIAVCGGTLLYFIRRLLKGLFKLHPVCWTIGFLGGVTILIQVFDRMPSILNKKFHYALSPSMSTLFNILEEGQELLLPLFVILALLQAFFIYVEKPGDEEAMAKYRAL